MRFNLSIKLYFPPLVPVVEALHCISAVLVSKLESADDERRCGKSLLSLSLSLSLLLSKCDNSIGFYKSEMLLFIDVGTVGLKNNYK